MIPIILQFTSLHRQPQVLGGRGATGTFIHCWRHAGWYSTSQELGSFLQKEVYDPEVMLLGMFPKELKTYEKANRGMWVFIAALSIIATT